MIVFASLVFGIRAINGYKHPFSIEEFMHNMHHILFNNSPAFLENFGIIAICTRGYTISYTLQGFPSLLLSDRLNEALGNNFLYSARLSSLFPSDRLNEALGIFICEVLSSSKDLYILLVLHGKMQKTFI